MRSRVMQTSWSAGNASEILLVIVWHGSGSFLKQSQKADKKKKKIITNGLLATRNEVALSKVLGDSVSSLP